ncbi:MAG: peroxiredoxin, partial [Calditrichota bacterium]
MLQIGDTAPDFTLPDEAGTKTSLSDFRGQRVVLYFYPKDNTPGCTKEGCSFRDADEIYQEENIKVLGVSNDDVASHQKYKEKYGFKHTLLADT